MNIMKKIYSIILAVTIVTMVGSFKTLPACAQMEFIADLSTSTIIGYNGSPSNEIEDEKNDLTIDAARMKIENCITFNMDGLYLSHIGTYEINSKKYYQFCCFY